MEPALPKTAIVTWPPEIGDANSVAMRREGLEPPNGLPQIRRGGPLWPPIGDALTNRENRFGRHIILVDRNVNDRMDVIRHHDERVNADPGQVSRQTIEHAMRHPPGVVQHHFAVDDCTKQRLPRVGADRHEIATGRRVVMPRSSQVDPRPMQIRLLRFPAFVGECLSSHDAPPTAHRPSGGIRDFQPFAAGAVPPPP